MSSIKSHYVLETNFYVLCHPGAERCYLLRRKVKLDLKKFPYFAPALETIL